MLGAKGWIIAAPASPLYDNESSINPLMDALKRVKETYKIDDRRIVLAGHNAGAMMGWRLAITTPAAFSSIVAL